MLDSATELEINVSSTLIDIGEPLIHLKKAILKELSTDQSYGYQITQAIKTGHLPSNLGLLEVGPGSHSWWLTTANRLCHIWVSKHGLKGKTLKKPKND